MTTHVSVRRHPWRVAAAAIVLTLPLATAACTRRPGRPTPTTAAPTTVAPTTVAPTTVAPTTTEAPPTGENAVTFQTAEFSITRTQGIPTRGTNVITVTNAGQYTHEVIFIKADSWAALPTKENGAVDMSLVPAGAMAGAEHMHLASGETATETVTFTPGRWVALCNIEHNGSSHFANGQFLEFTVV